MADFDVDRINALFTLVQACADHSGKFPGINAAAMNELQDLNGKLREEQMEKAKEDQRVAAEAEANRQRELAQQNDAENNEEEATGRRQVRHPRSIPSTPIDNAGGQADPNSETAPVRRI